MRILSFFILLTLATSGYGQVVINELMASNESTVQSPVFGEFSDWIELYNDSDGILDISGYFITDDKNDSVKWALPENTLVNSHGYLIIWADDKESRLHTNFKLSKDGDAVYLYDRDTALVDKVVFGGQTTDISYGREQDGTDNWVFFKGPSPGKANGGMIYNPAGLPQFSLEGGFYNSPISISLQAPSPTAEVRYTLDGSPPGQSSFLYEDSIKIRKTTVIRARVYDTGFEPGNVVTNTFFINVDKPLPVLSISTLPAYLWSDTAGIYVKGTNGIPGNCRENPMNWNQDWEIPINIEYYDEKGNKAFGQQAGMKIFGGCSRTLPQKSVSVIARNQYGKNSFDYRLFDDLPFDSYKSFVLRNAGNDWGRSMIRDALCTKLAGSVTDIDHQAYRPVVVYINGTYWGIHNIREKINEHFLAQHHNVGPNDINLLEGRGWAKHGSNADYTAMKGNINILDLSDPDAYNYVKGEMDIDNYIDYQVGQIIIGNTDWPGNNIRFWKTKDPGSKWRWILYDTDFAFDLFNHSGAYHNTLAFAAEPNGDGWPNPPWSTLLFRKLLENETFSRKFIDRFSWMLNNAYNPEKVNAMIDSIVAGIEQEMPAHLARWQSMTMGQWKRQIDRLRTYAAQRPEIIMDYAAEFFGLNPSVSIRLYTNGDGGVIRIDDGQEVTREFSGQYFKNESIKLRAVPAPGYRFASWERITLSGSLLIGARTEWKYLDDGTDQGTAWKKHDFDDTAWKSGNGTFGYGNGDEQTKLSYGGNADNKFITTYFRKSFDITDPSDIRELSLRLMCDDGAVVYLNGRELLRTNLPQGNINYLTTALTAIGGEDETTYNEYTLDAGSLRSGTNILAVEIHQVSKSSSDIRFDLSLSGLVFKKAETISDENVLIMDVAAPEMVMAVFKRESPVINEIHYNPAEGPGHAFVELYNQSADTIELKGYRLSGNIEFAFPDTAVIPPGGYTVVAANPSLYGSLTCPVYSWNFGDFSSAKDTVELIDAAGETIDKVVLGKTAPWPSSPDGTGPSLELIYPFTDNIMAENWQGSAVNGGTPGRANSDKIHELNLKINEVLAGNKTVFHDGYYEYDDWIEIYNDGSTPADMSGCFLSDDKNNLKKFMIMGNSPVETVIAPGGFKLFWADGRPEQGWDHLNFKLSKSGETVYVSDSSGVLLDSLYYVGLKTDVSIGKYPDGVDYLFLFPSPTPEAPNNFAPVFDSSPVTDAFERQPYVYDIALSDMEGDDITISGRIPPWLAITPLENGRAQLTGTPGRENVGNNYVKIMARDNHGGTVEQYFTIRVAAITGIEDMHNKNLLIYPNPFQNTLTVFPGGHTVLKKIEVLSLNGKTVFSRSVDDMENQPFSIRLDNVKPGMYLLKVITDNSSQTFKILKD